ncbi:MAG: Asp-tRNA(Asn)/Glu-tRNA(Gln) amidotransferase subunit GatA [Ezakiella sp.]|nr:Asp-tRNA(Asn)/Glu-tRNA(Gln) amidotransferase subunit GatA [Ezakiella sp.]
MMRYLHETIKLIKDGKISEKEHLEELIDRVKEDEKINSFITLDIEGARKRADKLPDGPLHGAIVGIKDNVNVKGLKTTCASRMLSDFTSVYDADITKFIRESGANILGKLNMDEFAMGSSNETSFFGPVKNPIDNTLVPGGSSGGSAAAVSMGFVDVSIGTDTGGSVRQPSSFCSVVGVKPTYGAVSRYGVTSLANTFDTVGTIGRCVKDAYLLLQNINKNTTHDMTKIAVELPDLYSSDEEAIAALKGKKIAIYKNFNDFHFEEPVRKAYENSIDLLIENGVQIVEEEFKYMDYAVGCYYNLIDSECSSNLSRFDGIRYAGVEFKGSVEEYMTEVRSLGFSDEVKRRILLGMYILSSDNRDQFYGKAQLIREGIKEDYDRIFKKVDAILTPTAIELPFKLGSKFSDTRKMMEGDLLTVATNIAGVPAISVPTSAKREINPGMQFIADKKNDYKLASIAMGFEAIIKENAR